MKRNSLPNYVFHTLLIILTCSLATTGLIKFVKLKNQQIHVSREIEEVEDRIAEAELDIQMEEIAKNRLLNRFQLAQRLKEQDSPLVPIRFDAVETLPYDQSSPEEGLASSQP